MPHQFVITIPVADRPLQLRRCLQSLVTLCDNFPPQSAPQLLLADDSAPEGRAAIAAIAAEFNRPELIVEYFGPQQQLELLQQLQPNTAQQLHSLLGTAVAIEAGHKGASLTRNLLYLRLWQLQATLLEPLFLFIDSDESFHADIDYFGHYERLFTQTDSVVATGKVDGDPPVSPAVMARSLLTDLTAILTGMSQLSATDGCQFHTEATYHGDDGGYHDMASLFGLTPKRFERGDFHCRLQGEHSHFEALLALCQPLNHFFDGEHPTRITPRSRLAVDKSIQPARTVYTGNYIVNRQGLRHAIPFAALKLRMAGPTLGRLLKAELGHRFVTLNLPLHHHRTTAKLARAEFRPGIEHRSHHIDISGEFERQFWGDVMLFSVEALSRLAPALRGLSGKTIESVVTSTQQQFEHHYQTNLTAIEQQSRALRQQLTQPHAWWHHADHNAIVPLMAQFLDHIEYNFGDRSQNSALISNASHSARLAELIDAIERYPTEQLLWQQALSEL
ncbi:hypothetical protein D5085_03050 [Ectothiorhodospiraceae bacterium BW-2]|nr:hypothetical protein D5085_03050 [Ectothiorhodospiraceae bacterium BW-2]